MKLLIAILFLVSCGQQPPATDPNATAPNYGDRYDDGAEDEDEPEKEIVEVPVPAPIEEPIPDEALWHDPLTDLYWVMGGKGKQSYLATNCYGKYRPATYYEIVAASMNGIGNAYPNVESIWSGTSAYMDPKTGKTYFFYLDLATGSMQAGEADSVHNLVCVWKGEE